MQQLAVSLALFFSLVVSGLALMLGMHSVVIVTCLVGMMVILCSGALDSVGQPLLKNSALLGIFLLAIIPAADHIWA